MDSYGKLAIASLLPVIAAVIFWILQEKTAFKKLPYVARQVIIGVVFGAIAIVGTEWGIPMNGAQVNCRDAAPLTAGLLFGGPAGIIAGVIGGVERWIAVAWGVGSFTRIACSVSTILAGFYAALVRKHLFENRRPKWYIALAVGVVMEVFHLTMVFVTNLGEAERAIAVVKACSAPMIIANGLAVMFAALLISAITRENLGISHENIRISDAVQRRLFIVVIVAYILTTGFTVIIQMGLASNSTDTLLDLAIRDISYDVSDASDTALVAQSRVIADVVESAGGVASADTIDYAGILEHYGISELNIVNTSGVIIGTSYPEFLGYNMYHGNQSAEFCKLLTEWDEYVQEYGPISYDPNIWRKYIGIALENGFVQIGYSGEQFNDVIEDEIQLAVRNRHVGQNGFLAVTDEHWNVIAAPDGFPVANLASGEMRPDAPEDASAEIDTISDPIEDQRIETTVNGTVYYTKYQPSNGYNIFAFYSKEEALQSRDLSVYVNTFMEILVFAALFGLIYLIIKKIIVDRMHKINNYLQEITEGNLDVQVDVRTNQEFTELSDGINATVGTLKRYIAEAAARIDAELEFAKNIQSSALPSVFPAYPQRNDFDIYALMDTAKEVGGDFYDFYFTHRNTFHILIADVSGKGIPASLFMMRAKTELKSLTEAGQPVNDAFTNGNNALCEGNDAGMFVTGWQGTIDLENGAVKFANAGHNPPLIYHAAEKQFSYLKSKVGFVLAGMEGVRYKEQELQLQPGDIVFLYTDGVTEATDANNELYGEERLLSFVNSREWASMEEMLKATKDDVDAFVGEAPQFDDITMLGFRYNGQPPKPTYHSDEAKIADIPALTEFVESELEKMDCPMKTVMQIDIAIDEIYSNIANYAYEGFKVGPATVEISQVDQPNGVEIKFTDEGIPYNPMKKEDPDTTLSADERQIGGLGIFMVKKSMDDMRYEYRSGKNILILRKNF